MIEMVVVIMVSYVRSTFMHEIRLANQYLLMVFLWDKTPCQKWGGVDVLGVLFLKNSKKEASAM